MNKNKIYSMILVGIFMLLCLSVLGTAQIQVTGLTDNKVVLNVDYGDLNRDDEDNDTMALDPLSLTFENTGNSSEAVSLSFTGLPSDYQLSLSEESFTLNASESKIIDLDALVPVDEDSGTHAVGKLDVNGQDYDIETQVESMLKIEDIKVYVDGEKQDTLNGDGDKIRDVRPGAKVELKFRIKNDFDNDYRNGDVSNADLTLQFDDNNDEDDFEDTIDEEEEFDLNAGERTDFEDVTMEFYVPTDAREKTYDLDAELTGEDDNGAEHNFKWLVELEIRRERDDIELEKVELESSTLSCTKSTTLKVVLTNFGSNNQRDAALSIYNKDLGIDYNFKDIYLDEDPDDEDNSYSKTITLNCEDAKAGDYYIEVYAYRNGDEKADYKDIKLTIEDCPLEQPVEEEQPQEDNNSVVVQNFKEGETPATPPSTEGRIIETTETSFSQNKGLIIFGVILAVLLITLIVLVIYSLAKKR